MMRQSDHFFMILRLCSEAAVPWVPAEDAAAEEHVLQLDSHAYQ